MCSDAGRSGVGELRKPVTYSVTEQTFPGISSSTMSSPVHHLDLREVPPSKNYLPYQQLCSRAAVTASSSPAGSLRSAGRVRFLHDPAGTLPVPATELCDPTSSDELACLAGSSLTAPSSSVLRVRCLRGQPGSAAHHFQQCSSSIDDLLPPSVICSHSVVSPEMSLMSKYSQN